jgi:hypothetical protein
MMKKNSKPGKRPRKKKYVQMEISFPPDPGQDAYIRKKRIQIGGEILEKITKRKL